MFGVAKITTHLLRLSCDCFRFKDDLQCYCEISNEKVVMFLNKGGKSKC